MEVTSKEETLAEIVKAENKEAKENQSKTLATEGMGRMLSWKDRYGHSHQAVILREYTDTGVFLVGNPDNPTKVRTRKEPEWKGAGINENVAVSFTVN
jgi:hypothetical protein